ncbi:hypothetical protein FO519_004575 [Halicephalobus sp. NKZ332]|nr:hypothetical protein FO519_004575 [Halicephalobus sp. NKZ332]
MADSNSRRIQPLPTEVVNRIAAGEVIQKPWNAVKELLENSIDAGSKFISITLRDGGYTGIIIKDDGCGIHPEDTKKIATRFHSSKIKAVEDVYKIKTFGFRGEALSSMATAGKVTIISKKRENQQGVRVFVEGSERVITPEDNLEDGTQIHVTGLFSSFTLSNVKKSILQITTLVRDYSLVLPNVKLILYTPEVAFRSPVDGSPVSSQKVWMESIFNCTLHEIDMMNSENSESCGKLYFSEVQSNPKGGSKNPNYIVFVNQRLVEIPGLVTQCNQALSDAGVHINTIVCLFDLDPSCIDVHVSPTKHLVNIRDGGDLVANVVERFSIKIDEIHGSNEVAGIGPVTVSPSSSQRPVVDIRNHFSVSDDFKNRVSEDIKNPITVFEDGRSHSTVPPEIKSGYIPQGYPSSFSNIPWGRGSQEFRTSTSNFPAAIPSQKVRIDHAQMTLHSFVEKSDKQGNQNSFASINDTTRTSQALKKLPVLAPVVIPVHTTLHTMYRIVSFLPVTGFVEEKSFSDKVHYSYSNRVNGKSRIIVFEVVNHENIKKFPEDGQNGKVKLRELIIPDSLLIYTNLSIGNMEHDFFTVEKVTRIISGSGWKNDFDPFWTEKVRKSVNVKISRVDEANYFFFQYKAEFFVTPFFVVLQEYIFQILMENVCNLKMVGDNSKSYSYKKFIDREFPEKYVDVPQHWDNLGEEYMKSLKTIFSLEVKTVEDDIVLSGIPLIFENKKEIFEPFLLLVPKILPIDVHGSSDDEIREKIVSNALTISNYVAGYLDNVSGMAEKWTHSDVLKLCSEYFPGRLFMKFTTVGDSVMLYKCFEREYMQNVMDNLGTPKIDSTAILLKSYEKKQEAATYFNLKPAIVVEIGSRWTRYGMSGEYHPRGLLNSITVNPDDGKKVHWLCNGLPKEQKQCLILSMMKTIINRFMLHNGGEGRLVIVENILTPSADRELLVDTVFEHRSLMVTDVFLVPAPIATTMAYGTNTALVVNIGYHETTIYPVCDQVILLGSSENSDVGSKYLLDQIREYFHLCGKVKSEDGTLENFSQEDLDEFDRSGIAEDIASGLCIASSTTRGPFLQSWDYEKKEDHFKFIPNSELPLGKKTLVISGFIREAASECFFTPEKFNDRPSLPELIFKCLKNCPIDYRKKLAGHIIITGGPSEMKGIFPRIRKELKNLLEEKEDKALSALANDMKFLTIPGNNQEVPISRFDAWIGGAIYGSISSYSHKVLKNQDYARNKRLPDWTDIVDNYKIPVPVDCKISEADHILAVKLKEVL